MDEDPKDIRDQALANFRRLAAMRSSPDIRLLPMSERKRIFAAQQEAAKAYYRTMVPVAIARCPYDQALTAKRMDVYGVDGQWWDVKGWDSPPAGCPHLVTYNGALLNAEKLVEDTPPGSEVRIGPEAPYVIPRLLEKPVVCVIARVPILTGAYLMTYFADPPLPGKEGSEPWLRQEYYYTDRGSQMWNIRADTWDFDLAKWVDRGKVYWIAPGDATMTLLHGPAKDCPYVGLSGVRAPRLLTHHGVSQAPVARPFNAVDVFD